MHILGGIDKMKNYTITVNGVAYDVTVEEGGAGSAPVRAAAPAAKPRTETAPAAAPSRPPPAHPAEGRKPAKTPALPAETHTGAAAAGSGGAFFCT